METDGTLTARGLLVHDMYSTFSFPYNFFVTNANSKIFLQGKTRGSSGCFNEEPISKFCEIPYEI